LELYARQQPALVEPRVFSSLKNRTLSPVAQLFIDCAREVAKPLAKVKAKTGSDRGAS
jgi:hypothetical protein